MTVTPRLGLALTLTAGLAACAATPSYWREAGNMDEGSFGNATMNNSLLMMGQLEATSSLTQRFASEVPSTITFPFNSAQITPQAAQVLAQQAHWIRQFPEVRFRVYGHTDEVGSAAYNQSLGLARARTVVAFFASQGVSPQRLEAVASFGETRPVQMTGGPNEVNRRTVTQVSGFVETRARSLNGKYAAVVMREYVEGATREHPGNTEVVSQVDPTSGQK